MSEKFIPENVDPFRLAEQNLQIDGVVKIVDMHRLNASRRADIANATEVVNVRLTFGVDEQAQANVRGNIHTVLKLQCQRCMEHFNYEIISDFALGIVRSLEEAKSLSSEYEPALVKEDGQLALRDLVEDELILNLPLIPKHEPDICETAFPLADSSWEEAKGDSPFQVLQALKQKET